MGSLALEMLPSLAQQAISLAAFADWNKDKHTDLFTTDTKGNLNVFVWDKATTDFSDKRSFNLAFESIANIVPGDFDKDGSLDVLAMGQRSKSNNLDMAIAWGPNATETLSLPPASGSAGQPFLVDFNGTMETQLLGYTASNPSYLSLWRFHPNRTVTLEKANLIDAKTATPICTFSTPHSNAFLDLNGDCLADIFVTCTEGTRNFFQVWINSRDAGFSLAIEQDLPSDPHGAISFADMDRDGTMDIVFLSCDAFNSRSCFINVWYNHQIPLCASSVVGKGAKECRSVNDLCVADPEFRFQSDSEGGLKLAIRHLLEGLDETVDVTAMPLRLGDFDSDGFPDILMLTYDKTTRYIRLIRSVPCTKLLCSLADYTDHKRYYNLVVAGMDAFNNFAGGTKVGAAFFDLYEDGTLDLLVMTQDSNRVQHITAFQNQFYVDGFFLKSLVLNGVCPAWCTTGERFPDPKPYGVNYFGATLKYIVTNADGEKRATQLSQLPQSSYFSLNTPYTLSGLGRTNNYIETLFVGATKQREDNVATYFGVIPNSQLVIVPYGGPSELSVSLLFLGWALYLDCF
ncbi:hypothetical protein HDU98_009801 [Podochytrium sp. JEL0797]|nr:hypothetical protein HDU98_009801 [Podochytrium sp. JEL0797]